MIGAKTGDGYKNGTGHETDGGKNSGSGGTRRKNNGQSGGPDIGRHYEDGHRGQQQLKNNTIQKQVRNYATSEEMDADYMAAVESGDMETAQRMVEEAANTAFPSSKIYDENGNLIPLSERFDEKKRIFGIP